MQLPQVTEINEIRVLTTQQVSDMYGTNRQTISHNFNYNKPKFQEGKHYIVLSGQALRDFKGCHENLDNLKYAHIAYLWTEKGALLHAKSVNTDKAWEAYDYLVDFYFRAKDNEKKIITEQDISNKKGKISIPYMEDPMYILKNLLLLADEQEILLKAKDIETYRSVIKGKRIAIHKHLPFEAIVYEAAYELAHYFIHFRDGDLIKSPFSKDYNEQAERAADMIIKILNIKSKY